MSLQDGKLTVYVVLRLDNRSRREKIKKLAQGSRFRGSTVERSNAYFRVSIDQHEQENLRVELKKWMLDLNPLELRALCVDEALWPLWRLVGKRGKEEVTFQFQHRFHNFTGVSTGWSGPKYR